MSWTVEAHQEFVEEFSKLASAVKVEIEAHTRLLEAYGPELGRPHADRLNGSKHTNMKELRFRADNGVWRVAFAFDPERKAILLVAGDKSGRSQKRFYKTLIAKANARFDDHLSDMEGGRK